MPKGISYFKCYFFGPEISKIKWSQWNGSLKCSFVWTAGISCGLDLTCCTRVILLPLRPKDNSVISNSDVFVLFLFFEAGGNYASGQMARIHAKFHCLCWRRPAPAVFKPVVMNLGPSRCFALQFPDVTAKVSQGFLTTSLKAGTGDSHFQPLCAWVAPTWWAFCKQLLTTMLTGYVNFHMTIDTIHVFPWLLRLQIVQCTFSPFW